MPDDAPLQLVLGVFADAPRAEAVRDRLRIAEQRGVVAVLHMTVLRRNTDGELRIVERRGVPPASASLAKILQLVCGLSDSGSDERRLAELAEALPAGSSAIAALVEHRWLEDVRAAIKEAGSEAVVGALKRAIGAALGEGRDLVLTAGAADWSAAGGWADQPVRAPV